MIGKLQDSWVYIWDEVWIPLRMFDDSPTDLFVQIYDVASDFIIPKPTSREYEEIINDPIKAELEFQKFQPLNFPDEISLIRFLEQVYRTLNDFGISGLSEEYKKLIEQFLEKYNLRYKIQEPFRFIFQFPGTFVDLYSQLQEINEENSHLKELITDFEEAYSGFSLTKSNKDLKTCIAKASNYAEGVASFSLGQNQTLGRACDLLPIWPHEAIKESVKSLYKFCSDYPSLRHSGNPAGKIRNLESKDTLLISLLLISFSGYLNTQVKFE